jgi:quercetin dioxygenase-like cupin family protein
MNIKAVIIAACLAVATPAAAQSPGEAITPNFKHAIPNIPGKSLVTLVVDYAPGSASRSHTHAKSACLRRLGRHRVSGERRTVQSRIA